MIHVHTLQANYSVSITWLDWAQTRRLRALSEDSLGIFWWLTTWLLIYFETISGSVPPEIYHTNHLKTSIAQRPTRFTRVLSTNYLWHLWVIVQSQWHQRFGILFAMPFSHLLLRHLLAFLHQVSKEQLELKTLQRHFQAMVDLSTDWTALALWAYSTIFSSHKLSWKTRLQQTIYMIRSNQFLTRTRRW